MTFDKISRLYPQYEKCHDRRKQNIPVAVDRRSGNDRRSEDRVSLDTKLTKDIFDVKRNVMKIEELSPKFFEHRVTTQNPGFTSQNNMTQDMLIKQAKPDYTAIARQEAQLKEKADLSFKVGVITAALGGAIAISFMGTAGAVIAVGTSLYIGARILKIMMDKEIKDDDTKIKK